MGYIQNNLLLTQCKIRKSFSCAEFARTHTLIHYQIGHHESCRKLALLEFPVHPSDGSPLFLETEDRVHPHTHKWTHSKQLQCHKLPQHISLTIAAVLYSVPIPLQQQPSIFSLSTHQLLTSFSF